MAENWQRIFTVSSLIFAFFLICGSIYLHLKQKHHLGRLRHDDRNSLVITGGVEAATDVTITLPIVNETTSKPFSDFYSSDVAEDEFFTMVHSSDYDYASDEEDYGDDINDAFDWNNMDLRNMAIADDSNTTEMKMVNISNICLQCICKNIDECREINCSDNKTCSFFIIPRQYWIDAGRPLLKNYSNNTDIDSDYRNCVNDMDCSRRTVLAYFNKYAQNCNRDDVVDCLDLISLHEFGPSMCRTFWFVASLRYRSTIDCLKANSNGN